MDDYYSILELNKNCSKEDIKKKYHRLSLKYHPDKNEGGNSERFRRITDAYKILYDDDRRKLYETYEEANKDNEQFLRDVLYIHRDGRGSILSDDK